MAVGVRAARDGSGEGFPRVARGAAVFGGSQRLLSVQVTHRSSAFRLIHSKLDFDVVSDHEPIDVCSLCPRDEVAHLIAVPVTGCGINPARSLGPGLLSRQRAGLGHSFGSSGRALGGEAPQKLRLDLVLRPPIFLPF